LVSNDSVFQEMICDPQTNVASRASVASWRTHKRGHHGRVMRSRMPVTKEAGSSVSGFGSGTLVSFRIMVMLRSPAAAALVSGISSPSQIWRLVSQRSSTSSGIFHTYQHSFRLFVDICHHLYLHHLLVLVFLVDTHCVNPYWRVQNMPQSCQGE
jgi:hypothetical protein